MVCAKCGAALTEGSIYCSRCGQEVQIVSELNVLEEEYLRSLMDEKKDSEKEEDPDLTEDRKIIRNREEKNARKREISADAVSSYWSLSSPRPPQLFSDLSDFSGITQRNIC